MIYGVYIAFPFCWNGAPNLQGPGASRVSYKSQICRLRGMQRRQIVLERVAQVRSDECLVPFGMPVAQGHMILLGLPCAPCQDAYSFGLVLWEMLTWERPFKDENEFRVGSCSAFPPAAEALATCTDSSAAPAPSRMATRAMTLLCMQLGASDNGADHQRRAASHTQP